MGLNFQKKQQVVSKISQSVGVALSAIVASLEGITANELAFLRRKCRENDVYVYVVRNTLICRAFDNSIFKSLYSVLTGSNIIAFSTVEANDCIKVFVNFSKENVKFKIKGAVFDGMFIEESKINFLSSLPSYKDSIVSLIFIIRESAIGKLIRLLSCIVDRRKDKE